MLTYGSCYRYVGKLSRLEAEQCLEGLRDGTYLVRKTESKHPEYTHAIAVRLGFRWFLVRQIMYLCLQTCLFSEELVCTLHLNCNFVYP